MEKVIPNNSEDILIKKSINGLGIFSKKYFNKFESIFEIKGSFFEVKEEPFLDYKTISNSIRYDEKTYLNPRGEYANYLNHSCNPNSFIKKTLKGLFLFSFKEILTFSEITIDYSTIMALDDFWKMKCNCGEKNCRKIVGNYKSIPEKIFKEYLSLGLIPTYILNINT